MKRVVAIMIIFCTFVSFAFAESASEKLAEKYAEAELLLVEGNYDEAAVKFDALGSYSDASKMAVYCKALSAAETYKMYSIAVDAFAKLEDFKDCKQLAYYYTGRGNEETGDTILDNLQLASDEDLKAAVKCYDNAREMYTELSLFKDCLIRAASCSEKKEKIVTEQETRTGDKTEAAYQQALELEKAFNYEAAMEIYQTLNGYKDCDDRIVVCKTGIQKAHFENGITFRKNEEWDKALKEFELASTYEDSADQITETHYQHGLALLRDGNWDQAVEMFSSLNGYNDSKIQISRAYYQKGIALREQKEWQSALDAFSMCSEYEDTDVQIVETYYQQAKSLCDEGYYKKAYILYNTIIDYKDVKDILSSVQAGAYEEAQKAFTKPYGSVIMGRYEQDGNQENGSEPIEWIVLDVQKGKALLICRDIIDVKEHGETDSWEASYIRKWLNETFISQAFDEREKALIQKTKNNNTSSSKGKKGKATEDYAFLLSQDDTDMYFSSSKDRVAKVSLYVYGLCNEKEYTILDHEKKSAFAGFEEENSILPTDCCGDWWLRSTDRYNDITLFIGVNRRIMGSQRPEGNYYMRAGVAVGGIRPALWVDIEDFY